MSILHEPQEMDDPELDKLEKQHAAKAVTTAEEEEFTDVEDDTVDALERASEALKNSAILFEYLANPDFCKSITKRERDVIGRHLDKLYVITDELDEAVAELEDEEDE